MKVDYKRKRKEIRRSAEHPAGRCSSNVEQAERSLNPSRSPNWRERQPRKRGIAWLGRKMTREKNRDRIKKVGAKKDTEHPREGPE